MKPLSIVTGATGYIGGRLVRRLEEANQRVRCFARRPEHLRGRVASTTEVVAGDVLYDYGSLLRALAGVHTAFYLIHSMGSSGRFEKQDRMGARNFAAAARRAGVRRIIYLGGLGSDDELSPHLHSRHEVGEILRNSGVETIEFRASIIVGSGSLSFELVRALVEKLPVMITPRWVSALAQPIGVEDVLTYLEEAIEYRGTGASEVFEIGGPDRISYLDLMRELDLDIASEFLVMAATLALIKSRMLLPSDEQEEDSEGTDPRADLIARLLEYERTDRLR